MAPHTLQFFWNQSMSWMFYHCVTWVLYNITNYGRNLFCSLVSSCVCPTQNKVTDNNKDTSLLRYKIYHYRKKFYDRVQASLYSSIKNNFSTYKPSFCNIYFSLGREYGWVFTIQRSRGLNLVNGRMREKMVNKLLTS